MAEWSFLTTHARTLLFIGEHPDARLRDIAASVGVTERTAFGIVADLTEAGYVQKERDGRRNRYQLQYDAPLRDATTRERTVGEMLDLLGRPIGRPERRVRNAGVKSRGRATPRP